MSGGVELPMETTGCLCQKMTTWKVSSGQVNKHKGEKADMTRDVSYEQTYRDSRLVRILRQHPVW